MRPAEFIGGLRYSVIAVHLSRLLRLFSLLLVAPFLVSLLSREWENLLLVAAVMGGAFLLGSLGIRIRCGALELREALVVTALAYLEFALLGSVLFLGEASWLDAFFESMSGFTTTGLTVFNPEELPQTLLFFRAYSQWIGGLGIVVLSLIVLLEPGKGSLKLHSVEVGEENIAGSVIATARVVLTIYAGLTAGIAVVYLLAGFDFFDALLHTFTTVSTGGFSSFENSIGALDSPVAGIAVLSLMFLGAIGYPSYYLARTESFRKLFVDNQVILLFLLPGIGLGALLLTGGLALEKIWEALFHLVSALTTTGYSVSGIESWSAETQIFVIFFMILGGSSGSTAGGIKLIRFLIFLRLIHWFVVRPLLPSEAKLPFKVNHEVLGDRELKLAFAFFGLYLALIFVSGVGFMAYGFSPADSFFEVVSALGTVGLSSGVTSGELMSGAKLILILDMWAGRLEILPILVLFYFVVWNPVRSKV